MAITTINATCACNAFKLQIELPNSELPYERSLCMCNTCRSVTGSCGISSIPLPESQIIKPSEFNLTRYQTSQSYARYFCTTCGAHVLLHCLKDDSWHLPSGLANRTEGILKWVGCEWVEDTLDGGIGIWLGTAPDSQGHMVQPKRWLRNSYEETLVKEGEFMALSKTEHSTDKLKVACHCGGVKFHIIRPDAASDEEARNVFSPFSDSIVPFHLGDLADNPKNEQWWLRADGTKYFTGMCTCTSCRLNSGFEIQPWAFVPKCNILKEDGTIMDFKTGSLKTYTSSEKVYRDFCSTCGATIFWRCDLRPLLIDVSVGVFDPAEGARAENWLWWNKSRVSFRELCVSESLVASLEAGLAVAQGS